ncbi:hypothetical protein J2W23_002617 [Variovorax boronicumulans]|nr:hypothetical protein [Variovorax boronicumulans]
MPIGIDVVFLPLIADAPAVSTKLSPHEYPCYSARASDATGET